MAGVLVDPFAFTDEDYFPSCENDFSESFLERIFGSDYVNKKRKANPSK